MTDVNAADITVVLVDSDDARTPTGARADVHLPQVDRPPGEELNQLWRYSDYRDDYTDDEPPYGGIADPILVAGYSNPGSDNHQSASSQFLLDPTKETNVIAQMQGDLNDHIQDRKATALKIAIDATLVEKGYTIP